MFVDFSKAFDCPTQVAIGYKLCNVGLRGNLLRLLQNMYGKLSQLY